MSSIKEYSQVEQLSERSDKQNLCEAKKDSINTSPKRSATLLADLKSRKEKQALASQTSEANKTKHCEPALLSYSLESDTNRVGKGPNDTY